jgi:hypothetical protein
MMLKRMKPSSITYLAYVMLLLAFIALHVFVAELAVRSGVAAAAGTALVISLAAAVFGFRLGASRLARASEAAGSTHKLSIWADQLEQDRIDRYRATYRGEPEPVQPQARPETVAASTETNAAPAHRRQVSSDAAMPSAGSAGLKAPALISA